ncbi:MAG: DUF3147 family protein [bacterium]|nr:DUF3147 family protein [bacterium]
MQILVKAVVSLGIIFAATAVARRWPSAAGLIAVMPLTGALVLVWVHVESGGDPRVMGRFTRGALWGILPSILFFLVALVCFRRNLPLSIVLAASFGVWLCAAFIHQWMLE